MLSEQWEHHKRLDCAGTVPCEHCRRVIRTPHYYHQTHMSYMVVHDDCFEVYMAKLTLAALGGDTNA